MDRGERLSRMMEEALAKAKEEKRISEPKETKMKKVLSTKKIEATFYYDTSDMSRNDVMKKLKELREEERDLYKEKRKVDYYNPKTLKQKISFLRNVQNLPYPTSWFKQNEALTEDIFRKQYARWTKDYESLQKKQNKIDHHLQKIESERDFWKKELDKIPTKKQLKEQGGHTLKEREKLIKAKLEEEERIAVFKEKLNDCD